MIYVLKADNSNWRAVLEAIRLSIHEVESVDFDDVRLLKRGSVLVIPGVGHMQHFQRQLTDSMSPDDFADFIRSSDIRVLGICLGFQLMSKYSFEGEGLKCLSLFDSEVVQLHDPLRPSVGWKKLALNSAACLGAETLAKHLLEHSFYFTHSYGVLNMSDLPSACTSFVCDLEGGRQVLSALITEKFVGFQFHPEKSSRPGLELLCNSLKFLGNHHEQ